MSFFRKTDAIRFFFKLLSVILNWMVGTPNLKSEYNRKLRAVMKKQK